MRYWFGLSCLLLAVAPVACFLASIPLFVLFGCNGPDLGCSRAPVLTQPLHVLRQLLLFSYISIPAATIIYLIGTVLRLLARGSTEV
jgi:hypothetical protein